MREYIEGQWYRGFAGAVGIPLFSYLYHEYAIGYGGDSASIGPRGANTAWNLRCHAVNLVTGKTPGAATWMFPDQLFNSDPRPIRMIRNHRRLLAAGAGRYLMEGRMLHPFQLSSPVLSYALTHYDSGKPEPFQFTESAVLTSSWQAPGAGLCDVSLYRSEADVQFHPIWKAVTLPKRFSIMLEPDEVLFLELRSAR